jgi:hypothetical protein
MATSLEFWFRKKYGLPPTDPRFLDASLDDMEADFWAHSYSDRPPGEEVEDDEFDLEAEIAAMSADDWEEVSFDGRS